VPGGTPCVSRGFGALGGAFTSTVFGGGALKLFFLKLYTLLYVDEQAARPNAEAVAMSRMERVNMRAI
jgi:hypothetical protein